MQINLMVEHETLVVELIDDDHVVSRSWVPLERLHKPRLHAAERVRRQDAWDMQEASDVLQNDLRELLEAVGLPSGARPQTPHTVFQEALVVVRAQWIALESIANHGHDCPAALDISEEEWQRRRATAMQRIAREALART